MGNTNQSSGSLHYDLAAKLVAGALVVVLMLAAGFYAREARFEAAALRGQERLINLVLSAGAAANLLQQERFLAAGLVAHHEGGDADSYKAQAGRVEAEIGVLRRLSLRLSDGQAPAIASAVAQALKQVAAIEPRRHAIKLGAGSLEATDKLYSAAIQSLLDVVHHGGAALQRKTVQDAANSFGNVQQAAELAAGEALLLLGWKSGALPTAAEYERLVARQKLYLQESDADGRLQRAEVPRLLAAQLSETRTAVERAIRRGAADTATVNGWLQVQTAYVLALTGIARSIASDLRQAAHGMHNDAAMLEYNSTLGIGLAPLLALLVLVRITRTSGRTATSPGGPAGESAARPQEESGARTFTPLPATAVVHAGRVSRLLNHRIELNRGNAPKRLHLVREASAAASAPQSAATTPAASAASPTLMERLREAADSFSDARRRLESVRGRR